MLAATVTTPLTLPFSPTPSPVFLASSATLSSVSTAPVITAFIAGVVVPVLTDALAASSAPKWVKSSLATVFSVLAGVISTVAFTPDSISTYFIAVGLAFMAAMTAHKAGISEPVQRAIPGGIAPRGDAPPKKYHI